LAIAATWPDEFSQIATSGYYVALRVGFAFPVEERNEFSSEWVEYYTDHGLMMFDPVMRWVYSNTGNIRWNEIQIDDPLKVRAISESFGLVYGVAICCCTDFESGQRSFGTFSRPDREFTADEMEVLATGVRRLHAETEPPNVTEAELEALRLIRDG
jgi:LuxR family transcriptional regulator